MSDDLFDDDKPGAYARGSDPQTSHDAAAEVVPHVAALEAKVLSAVIPAGQTGKNVDEVCIATGLDKVTVSPRFKPLEQKGFIRRASFTRPGMSNKQQTVWIATELALGMKAA